MSMSIIYTTGKIKLEYTGLNGASQQTHLLTTSYSCIPFNPQYFNFSEGSFPREISFLPEIAPWTLCLGQQRLRNDAQGDIQGEE